MAETSQDRILPMTSLKLVLNAADTKPIPCAFALTKDRKECVMLASKMGKPKPLAAQLKKEGVSFIDEKSMRFGFATVLSEDPGTLRLSINKSEAGGTIMALVRLAKKATYQGAVIVVDAGLDKEGEGATGDTPPLTELQPESPVQTAPPPPPPEAPPPPTQKPPVDTAALKQRLTGLVKRMIEQTAQDPSHKDEMTALAKQAQTFLGTGNPNLATEKADALEALLDGTKQSSETTAAPDAEKLKGRLTTLVKEMLARPDGTAKEEMTKLAKQAQGSLGSSDLAAATEATNALELQLRTGGQARDDGDFVRIQKMRLLWESARKKVESEIDHFKAAVESEFEGDENEDEIVDALDDLDEIIDGFDERLTDTFDEWLDAGTTPEQRLALIKGAQGLLGEYESRANSNRLFKKLEGDTPFGVSLSVNSTMTQALKVLRASLH